MIKTIQATNLRKNFKEAHNYVKQTKQPLIITERNVPRYVLVDIDEYEDYLSEKSPDLLRQIKASKKQKEKGDLFSMEDVFGDVV
jgi:prevent-host-death family protein